MNKNHTMQRSHEWQVARKGITPIELATLKKTEQTRIWHRCVSLLLCKWHRIDTNDRWRWMQLRFNFDSTTI